MRWRTALSAALLGLLIAFSLWRYGGSAPLTVAVAQDGGVSLEGAPLTLPALTEALRVRNSSRLRVVIQVDARARSTGLVAVMDAVQSAGVEDVQVQLLP